MAKFHALFLGLLLLAACQNPTPPPNNQSGLSPQLDSLYTVVVAKHDSIMPEIGQLEAYQFKLRKLRTTDSLSAEQKKAALLILAQLKKGHESMFDWMNAFKNPHLNEDFYTQSSEKELWSYLQTEEEKIEEVTRLMQNSMQNAKGFLEEIK
ncbi:hypothetical protein SapgrDRAFT_0653 [Saprospira grandis DSM 2844]|uniref:Viral A-type inclusion protein n=1 Tax=Saprospira grandis DSM 2844 TaxID=694433 RepID=J0XTW1_9BACT|nr:hypothetical protein [Saprospira grandis]EJF52396.1 hypothetical protein SapgrDRAFT_0653 [Saprospira grandis DSM 2844]